MIKGLGAMVWKLRNWESGSPVLQAEQCKKYGLSWISIKIVNGVDRKWEGSIGKQNADLMRATVEELVKNGVTVIGWGWTYGFQPREEADKTKELMAEYAQFGMTKLFQIDAESHYMYGMRNEAIVYSQWLDDDATMSQMLCSYRFPLTFQPSFPVREFMHICEFANPQVYFIGDNRPDAGALQLERSYLEYKGIKDVPFIGIAPTYRAAGGWRATRGQLAGFFQKAKDLGNPAVGIWDLPQATTDQLNAFLDVDWDNEPQNPDPLEDRVAKLESQYGDIDKWIKSWKSN